MATVGETCFLVVILGNFTSNMQNVKKGTLVGTPVPVVLVHRATPHVAHEQ